jgi:hypothetical protein
VVRTASSCIEPESEENEESDYEELPRVVLDGRKQPECVPRLHFGTHQKEQVKPSKEIGKTQAISKEIKEVKEAFVGKLTLENTLESQAKLTSVQETLPSTQALDQEMILDKKGRRSSSLLRPLYERKDRLLTADSALYPADNMPIKQGGKVKKSAEMQERQWEMDYLLCEIVQVKSPWPCSYYKTTRESHSYFICEYKQANMQEIAWKRGKTALEGLQNQASILYLAKHDHIIPLHEVRYALHNDRICHIFRFNFASSLMQLAPLKESSGLSVFAQMLSAITYFHSTMNMVLNDLHPYSFLVDTSGRIKLFWVYAAMPKTDAVGTGADLLQAVALLYLLLFCEDTDPEIEFEMLMGIFADGKGKLMFPTTCSKRLQDLFTLALTKRQSLCLSDLSAFL